MADAINPFAEWAPSSPAAGFDVKQVPEGSYYAARAPLPGGSPWPTPTPPSGENPFAEFTKEHQANRAENISARGGFTKNALAGVNEGIASTLGAPIDAMTWGANLIPRGVNAAFGTNIPTIKRPFLGSENIKSGMGLIGANPDDVPANTAVERIARGTGEGVGGMITGAGIVAALGRAGIVGAKASEIMQGIFGRPDAGTAAIGAGSGAGGAAAAEVAPEPFKPIARMGGGMVGGGVPVVGMAGVEAVRAAGGLAREFTRPWTQEGRQALAGREIANAATDVSAVKSSLSDGAQELVPGSRPTTFQQTGDLGLGQLERRARTQAPDQFIEREGQQNAARLDAVHDIQPSGSPQDVAAHFRFLRDTLDRTTQQSVDTVRQKADTASGALGGTGASAEGYGSVIRDPAQAARDAAKTNERALWATVDPTGRMVLPGSSIADTARSIEGGLSGSAKPLSGEERAIFDVAQGYGQRTPFRDVMDLRSRLSAAMADERRSAGFTPTYQRLVQLRASVENTIDNAVENQAHVERQAVARGQLAEQDSLLARLQQHRQELYERREPATTSLGAGSQESLGGNDSLGSGPAFAGHRAESTGGFGLRNAQGNPSLQEASRDGVPLDAAATARLRAASQATRERAQTFDQGSVGGILRPGARAGEYRISDAQVPAKVFHPGPTGGESVREYIQAVGAERAVPAISDYAAFSLRNAVARPDGTLDLAKVQGWINRHREALNELPPEVRGRFTHVYHAEEAVAEAAANRREQLAGFDRSALAHVMGLENDGDVVRHVGAVFNQKNAAQQMQQLATATNGSAAAREGLRRSVIDYLQSQFLSNTEVGTSGRAGLKADAFQTFMRTKADVLAKLFAPQEIGTLRAVAQDLQRANRTIAATKLKGGSNTAQDLLAVGKRISDGSILNRLAIEGAAATAGHALTHGFLGGAFGWLGGKVVANLRDAGLANIDGLVREAMLNPELARALLAKVPRGPDRDTAAILGLRARQLALAGSMNATTLATGRREDQ